MITQANRLLSIETPLPYDTLLIDSIHGTEAISRPFRYEVNLVADTAAGRHTQVDPELLIGNEVTIAILLHSGEHRYIHGIVKSFTEGGEQARFKEYQAEVVPWFDLLKLSSNCRFFQEKNVPDIIEQVFKDLDFRAYKLDLRFTYTAMDYCAQYRETDFDFVSRLMEQEGIFYYFEHTDDAHTMVLADSRSAYVDLPNTPIARYTRYGAVEEEEDIVMEWKETRELQSSKWKMRDFHFELQPKTLEVERPAITQRESASHLVMYDYPGGYAKKFNKTSERLGDVQPEGDDKVNRIRMEADEANVKVVEGESDIRALTAGYKIKVVGDDPTQTLGSYLVRDVGIEAVQEPSYVSEEPRERYYSNSFHFIPAETRFHPPQTTVKPLVAGPQSAWVVDESNQDPPKEEIWPDKFGRIRVRFQWDTEGKYACWLRVAQPWAGRGWGHQWVPRTGDEVLVDFVEGDPDCPIVVGSLYNPKNMPPFKLPDNKTQSGIVTRTSTKGTTHEFNMLRFEDKRSHEQVMIRSQRRADVRAYGSFYETNHANRHIVVGWENSTETDSGGDFNITVGGELNVHVKKRVYEKFDDKLDYSVHGDAVLEYQANNTTLVTNTYGLNAKQIILEASQKISLKVGGSCIVIDPTSITIAAAQVKINSGGYGTEVPDPGIDDPVDATLSDNGEPGYLDRIARGGGGRGGHHHRQLHAQHYVFPPRPGEDPRITATRNLLQNTPTGRHALEVIDRNNVNVVMGTGGGRYDDTTNTITLDQGRTDPAGSLVHEAGHADAHWDGRSADVRRQERADYIATQDREDAHNERLAYEAEQQLAANGTPQTYNSSTGATFRNARDTAAADYRRTHPDATDAEVNQYANDKAEDALFNDYQSGRVTTGTNGQTYPNYWGDDWDRRHNTPGP